MKGKDMLTKRLSGLVALLALSIAAACSTGQSNTTPIVSAAASNVPTLGSTYETNAVGGMTSYIATSGTGSLSITASASAPNGATPFARTASAKTAQSANGTPILYYTLTASTNTTITKIGFVNITMSSAPAGSAFMATLSGSTWLTVGGATAKPGAYSNGTLAVEGGAIGGTTGVTLNAGQSLYLVVYVGSIVTPTPAPPPAPFASPNTITVSPGGSGALTIETGANVGITATSGNTAVATVASSVTSDKTGTATLTVTGVSLGTATITFTDQYGQSGKAMVTVSNAPNPNPSVAFLSLNSQVTLAVSGGSGDTITAASSDSTVLQVNGSATVGSGGTATFTVTAKGPGTAKITFTNGPLTGSFSATVSSITNGGFTDSVSHAASLSGWTPCSFAYTWQGPLNASPAPQGTPAATPSPSAAIASTSLSALARLATPPPNLEPGNGGFAPNVAGSPIPGAVGANVAYLGDAGSETAGVVGICQSFTPSAASKYLWFWAYEGGSQYNVGSATQEADILDSTASTLKAPLFVEDNCFWDPGVLGQTGYTNNGCIPPTLGGTSTYPDWQGGYWVQRGPFDLTSYVGQPVTLFIGVWNKSTHGSPSSPTTYGDELFVGNVQTTFDKTQPINVPLFSKRQTFSIQLHR